MHADDIMIEVRDRALARKGQVTTKYVKLAAKIRDNKTGDWKITLPGAHPMVEHLSQPGSGIVVSHRTDAGFTTLFSGPTSLPSRTRNREQPDGTFVFEGKTDDLLADDARAFPDPANADATTQAFANDSRTGDAETLMREYVQRNIGISAPAGRKAGFRSLLRQTQANSNRGGSITKSPRFQILSELLHEIGTLSGLGYQFIQRGSFIEFEVLSRADRSAFVRFDIANGTLTSEEVQVTPPSLTRAIVAGQGEGAERTIIVRTSAESAASEPLWGRVIERFIDQRNTDDIVELEQSGDEALLADGFEATNVKVVPADDTTMLFGRDWNVGDTVTVVVNGQETQTTVTEAVILVDETKAIVGAAIGDVRGFNKEDALTKRVEDTERRVEAIERSVEIDNTALTLDKVLYSGNLTSEDLDTLVTPALYETASVVNGTLARHYPIASWSGLIEVYQHGGHIFQRATARADGTLAGRVWVRSKFSTNAWLPWRELTNTALPDAVYKTGIASTVLTGAVLSWQTLSGVSHTFAAQPRDLWLEVQATAIVKASTGYTMIGVDISGGITLGPSILPDGQDHSGQTPFSSSTVDTAISMHPKRVLLPAGSTATFAMWSRRSVASGTQTCNYPIMSICPLQWVDDV